MDTIRRDVKYAVIVLWRERGFAAAAILALALGIGATTAVFSVVYGVLLRPLPYPEPDRLVRIYEEHPGAPKPPGDLETSNTTLNAWLPRLRTLEDIAPYYALEYTVTFPDGPVRVHGGQVGPALFPLLRAVPQAGRFFLPGEDAPRGNLFVVISDRLWRDRLHAAPDAVGRALTIEGKPHVIVGVARPDFHFPDAETQLWTPYDDPTRLDPTVQGGVWLTLAIGRLKPGVTAAQASAEGTAAARSVTRPRVLDVLFGSGGPVEVRAVPMVQEMTAAVRPVLLVVSASVAFILLIACANVANLFLSRGVARQREFALRAALGAGRARLARQLLAESLLLSIVGAAAGLLLAWGVVRAFGVLAPADFPRLHDIRVDRPVAVFAALVSIAAAVLTGLLPAVRGTSFNLTASLYGGDGAVAGGFRGARARFVRDALLVGEAALAALLIVGAALFGRSFQALTGVDTGYTPGNVLVAQVFPPPDAEARRIGEFTATLLDRVRADPAVVSAGIGNMVPFSESTYVTAFDVPAASAAGKPARVRAWSYQVTPGYVESLGVRLRAGRLFDRGDEQSGRYPVLVNEEFARRYLDADRVLGRTLAGPYGAKHRAEIVGIVGNVLKDGADKTVVPDIYTVVRRDNPLGYELDLVVRTAGDPARSAAMVCQVVRALDPNAVVGATLPLASRLRASYAQPRFATAVLGAFATLALLLASLGLFGVLSYTVTQRRRELSVRAALGADRRNLLSLVLREGLALTAIGVGAGMGGALLLAQTIRGLLFGITPADPLAYAIAPLVLLPIAAAACLLPARRAAAAAPAEVLRL
jgi:predicted permease